MLCFNGPTSRSLIEEVGDALRNYLLTDDAPPSAATDVFAVYIEMTQNIRHYVRRKHFSDAEAVATVVIARDRDGKYIVSAGNVVETADGLALLKQVEMLAGLDKPQLKAAYRQQLRMPREDDAATGAGLGLIDIARRATGPLAGSLVEQSGGLCLFTLTVTI